LTLSRKLGAVAIAGFEEFFRDQRPRLFGSMLLITGDSHEADELVQEAFFKLWERWDRVGRMDNPTGYLDRTALNGAQGFDLSARSRSTTPPRPDTGAARARGSRA
jgi:DNA-directed RNA polymerase specialized sigma24 family protein